jgi:hypothetical protein
LNLEPILLFELPPGVREPLRPLPLPPTVLPEGDRGLGERFGGDRLGVETDDEPTPRTLFGERTLVTRSTPMVEVPAVRVDGAFATGGRGFKAGADDGKPITLRLLLGSGERERVPPPPESDIAPYEGTLRSRGVGASEDEVAETFTISAGFTRAFKRGPEDAAIADAVDMDGD